MHLVMIVATLCCAWWLRGGWTCPQGNWQERYSKTLLVFLFPPLLLMMMAAAVLCMGPQGQMLGLPVGRFSYWLVLSCLGIILFLGLKLGWQGWRSLLQVRSYSQLELEGQKCRILNTPVLFAAQIGFWQPELVVSEGLLQSLTPEYLETVLAHEQGHYYYRDTFWFFWLGWIRSWTAWLPQTEALWQDLLVLRELRADRWAAQQVDPLLLAESLLLVVSTPSVAPDIFCAALDSAASRSRLEERIEALLSEPEPTYQFSAKSWAWLLLAFLPLVTVLLHT